MTKTLKENMIQAYIKKDYNYESRKKYIKKDEKAILQELMKNVLQIVKKYS